jgi:phosphatidylinositol alpha-1,6-mannosyltransferase
MSILQPVQFRALALVTDSFAGDGGIAEYNRQFLCALAACDWIGEVSVLPRLRATSSRELPPGLTELGPVTNKLAYSFVALRTAITRRIDIIFCGHIFMVPLGAAIARLIRAPLWVQAHGIDAWKELSWLHRRSIEGAALVTSVSRYTRRRLLEWVEIDPARVKVLPNTVDPRFCPGPKPPHLLDRYGAHRQKVLLTVSRLASSERYKGHDRVIRILSRVLAQFPNTIYLIVGDGDDRPRLEALAKELGVHERVRFAGFLPAEDLPEHYRLADVFVMPSTGEGFGIAFLEAMASGLPVIGGNQDGSLDPLGDGTCGTAINPIDADALASAICTALANTPAKVEGSSRFGVHGFNEQLNQLCRFIFTMRRPAWDNRPTTRPKVKLI